MELATIISEVSLKGQTIRGKHTIPQICETADKPSYTPRKNDKRPHVWDKTRVVVFSRQRRSAVDMAERAVPQSTKGQKAVLESG